MAHLSAGSASGGHLLGEYCTRRDPLKIAEPAHNPNELGTIFQEKGIVPQGRERHEIEEKG
jgi:hypothetical protein